LFGSHFISNLNPFNAFDGTDVTINGYSGSPLINQDKNFFRQSLVKAMSSNEPVSATTQLINKAHNFTNYDIFKALGFNSNVPLVTTYIDKDNLLIYIKQNVDSNVNSIITFKRYFGLNYRTIQYFLDNYTTDTNATKDFKTTTIDDQVEIVTCPRIQIDSDYYFIKDNTVDDNNIFVVNNSDNTSTTLVLLDSNNNETDTTKDVSIDISTYPERIVVKYYHTNDNGDLETRYVFINNFSGSDNSKENQGMILNIKHNNSFIDKDKLIPALNKLGIKVDDIEDQLGSDIYDSFITYLDTRDGIFKQWIEDNYTDNTKVEINYNGNSLCYCKTVKEDTTNGGLITEETIKFNDNIITDNYFSNRMLIPFSVINDLPLRNRYKAIQETLTLLVHAEKEKHLSWYQTQDFTTIVTIAPIAIAIATGQAEAIPYIMGAIILRASNLSPRVKLVLEIMLLLAGNYNSTGSTTGTDITQQANTAVTITTDLVNAYNIEYTKHMQRENEKLINKKNEFINKLNEYAIYNPFDNMNNMFELPYELPYLNFEMYDNMCSVSYNNTL